MRSALLLGAALGAAACFSNGTGTSNPLDGPHLVLFIGNSLTYTNDLPRTVADVAALGGDTLTPAVVALPNFALIDHALGQSNALASIRGYRWEFVVLQQGPTWPGLCLDTLVLATRMLDEEIKAKGAHTVVFMSWPAASNAGAFDVVRGSFETAAREVGAVFAPAGEAWRAAWRSEPALGLYGSDGYHPSALGTFLSALVVYEQLTGHDPRSLPAKAVVAGRELNVAEARVRLLQQAAHEADTQFGTLSAPAPSRATTSTPSRPKVTC